MTSKGGHVGTSEDDPWVHLSADPWFNELEGPVRTELLARCERIRLRNQEYVFRKGDYPGGLYGLLRGTLKVSTSREDGKEAILAVLEPGNWFGEASAVDGLERSHDVMCVGSAEILIVQRDEFAEMMKWPGFALAIAKLQARHTRAIYAMLEDATLRSTRSRVIRRLQRLARGDITMANVDRRVISVTHDTLAMMLGITRQTLSLEIKALEARGALVLGYGRIEIVSMDLLRAVEDGQ